MQVGNYRQGISATLGGPSELQPLVCWSVNSEAFTYYFNFSAPGKGFRPNTSLAILQSPVFLVNQSLSLSYCVTCFKPRIKKMLPLPPEVTGPIGRIPFGMVLPFALAKIMLIYQCRILIRSLNRIALS